MIIELKRNQKLICHILYCFLIASCLVLAVYYVKPNQAFPCQKSFEMNAKYFSWFLLLTNVLAFQQNQFKVIFERVEIADFNPAYIGSAKSHNYKHNRTNAVTVVRGDLKFAYGYELKMEVQAYKMASNEYREFPTRFMFDYCEFASRNEFGLGELFACGNSTGCPFKKGLYNSCPWTPNSFKFPPLVPAGTYRVDLKLLYHSVEIGYLQGFGTIKYPECKSCPFQ